jgi:hypothetical protein
VKLTQATLFAIGYVLGAKAGHERYAQIVEVAGRASQRLEDFSARRAPGRRDGDPGRADRRS